MKKTTSPMEKRALDSPEFSGLSNMDIKKPYVSMPVWTVTYKNDK
jgi:hypothetical protein